MFKINRMKMFKEMISGCSFNGFEGKPEMHLLVAAPGGLPVLLKKSYENQSAAAKPHNGSKSTKLNICVNSTDLDYLMPFMKKGYGGVRCNLHEIGNKDGKYDIIVVYDKIARNLNHPLMMPSALKSIQTSLEDNGMLVIAEIALDYRPFLESIVSTWKKIGKNQFTGQDFGIRRIPLISEWKNCLEETGFSIKEIHTGFRFRITASDWLSRLGQDAENADMISTLNKFIANLSTKHITALASKIKADRNIASNDSRATFTVPAIVIVAEK